MAQINWNLFCIFVLPFLVGLSLGIILWKCKKTYLLSGGMLVLCLLLWCVISNVNTHGSELFGLIMWMFFCFSFGFLLVEIIKFAGKKCGK